MMPLSHLNRRNLFDTDYDVDDPMEPGNRRDSNNDVLDYSFGSSNLLSQNDVGWGSPMDESSKEAAEIRKKRRLANKADSVISTPLRIIKRCASSPALGEKRRSDPKYRPDEVKNLNDIFEDEENCGNHKMSQDLFSEWEDNDDDDEKNKTIQANDTSIDDFLMTIPLEEINKTAATTGASKVDLTFDPLAGSSQVVQPVRRTPQQPKAPPTKTFVRHTSLPISPSTAKRSPDEEGTQRRCTPAEIAAKRQAALEKLKKSRGNGILQRSSSAAVASQVTTISRTSAMNAPPRPSTSSASLSKTTTNVNLTQDMKDRIEANRRKALELREMKLNKRRT